MSCKGQWIVDVKGGLKQSFEISVVREDNEHGRDSYGWDGKDKIIIAQSSQGMGKIKDEWLFEQLKELAQRYADRLNHVVRSEVKAVQDQ